MEKVVESTESVPHVDEVCELSDVTETPEELKLPA